MHTDHARFRPGRCSLRSGRSKKSAGSSPDSGNPAETLTNIVHADSASGSRPTSARSICSSPIARRWCSPPRSACGRRASAASACGSPKDWPGSSPKQLQPQVVATPRASALQVLPRGRRGSVPTRFSACRSSIAALLQGVLVVQTREPRVFSRRRRADAGDGRARSWRRSSARRARSGSSSRPTHQRLVGARAEPVVELGQRHDQPVPRARSGAVARAAATTRSRCCSTSRSTSSRSARPQLALHSRINYAYRRMQEYLHSTHTWGARHAGVLWARPVAYFSAEFGLHESMPIYSGGLGILAGDHIKSASDLGIPLVGIGLYYDQGYFRQRLDRDGWQHEDYLDVDSRVLPMQPATRNGEPVIVDDRDADRHDHGARLEAVGRPQHAAAARFERRRQPARGSRADRAPLRRRSSASASGRSCCSASAACARSHALGISPGVVHLNEGHSAFAALELVRQRMAAKASTRTKRCAACRRRSSSRRTRRCRPGTIGFAPHLVEEHLGPLREALGLATERLHGAGAASTRTTARSILHDGARAEALAPRQRGVVAARPGVARDVDAAVSRASAKSRCRSATSPTAFTSTPGSRRRCARSTTGTSGPTGRERCGEPGFWEAIDEVDDGELWETHQTLKAQLIDVARRRAVRARRTARRAARSSIAQLRRALSLDALTIGFARRFATYKRANLILQDIEAIASLVNHPQMPMQLIFAGKAHPHDRPGKDDAAADRAADARPALRRQDPVHRGLRHQRRPPSRAGRRRLAEQAAAAARGLRHERAEGGAERRR